MTQSLSWCVGPWAGSPWSGPPTGLQTSPLWSCGLLALLAAGREGGEEAAAAVVPVHTCEDSSTCTFHVCPAGHRSAMPLTSGPTSSRNGETWGGAPPPPREAGLLEARAQTGPVQRKCGRCRRGSEPAGWRVQAPRCFRFQWRVIWASGFKGAFHIQARSIPVSSLQWRWEKATGRVLLVAGVCARVSPGDTWQCLETPWAGGWGWCRESTARAGKHRDAQGSPTAESYLAQVWGCRAGSRGQRMCDCSGFIL